MTKASGGHKIWILGLLHSGTTILWKSFRKDRRIVCFDEPLTGNLGACFPVNNKKGTLDEIISRFSDSPEEFWELYEPVELWQEFDSEFSAKQERYLRRLLGFGENLVIDETHLHLHVSALARLAPGSRVIHLYRRASGFATSHLLPSAAGDSRFPRQVARRLRQSYRKRVFFSRERFLPGMRRNEVIGAHPSSKFGLLLADAGYDANRIMGAPALVRLLAYWRYHYFHLERSGPLAFPDRFFSLPYERFANDPEGTMRSLYRWAEMDAPGDPRYPDVHRPKPPHRPGGRRWREAARLAGFTDEEIEVLL